jgi:hypothetical protein
MNGFVSQQALEKAVAALSALGEEDPYTSLSVPVDPGTAEIGFVSQPSERKEAA